MKRSNLLRDSKEVNVSLAQIERPCNLGVNHLVEVLHDDFSVDALQNRIVKSLTDLRAAIHPGCRLYRDPAKDLPKKLGRLVEATGASLVDYDALKLCCGVPAMYADPQFALEQRARAKVEDILAVKPDCIAGSMPSLP